MTLMARRDLDLNRRWYPAALRYRMLDCSWLGVGGGRGVVSGPGVWREAWPVSARLSRLPIPCSTSRLRLACWFRCKRVRGTLMHRVARCPAVAPIFRYHGRHVLVTPCGPRGIRIPCARGTGYNRAPRGFAMTSSSCLIGRCRTGWVNRARVPSRGQFARGHEYVTRVARPQ